MRIMRDFGLLMRGGWRGIMVVSAQRLRVGLVRKALRRAADCIKFRDLRTDLLADRYSWELLSSLGRIRALYKCNNFFLEQQR